MSGIQELVLGNTIIGKTPIFIVYNEKNDGDYLSLLLSNHFQTIFSNNEKAISVKDNFFMNEAFETIVANIDKKKFDGISSRIKLLIEEGFDTKRLYGVCLPYELFSMLDIEKDFISCSVLFVYNAFDTANLPSTIESFFSKLKAETIYINAAHCVSFPTYIVRALANKYNVDIKDELKISAHSFVKSKDFFSLQKNNQQANILQFCKNNDYITSQIRTLKNDTFEFAFYIQHTYQLILLSEKIKALKCIFIHPIQIRLFCENELTEIKQFVTLHSNSELIIQSISIEKSFICSFEQLIQQSSANYIFYDNLSLDYSIAACISALNKYSAELIFPALLAKEKNQQIQISDLLTSILPEDACIFSMKSYKFLSGFDSSISTQYFIWDFALQLAKNYPDSIYSTKASTNQFELNNENKSVNTSENYKKVITKHKQLIESSLNDIISSLSESNYSTAQEKKILLDKITSLQVVLSHSKDELKAFQHLTAQLHERIQHLENNWYQKIKVRVTKLKKIFFKKKSPGTGTLKRILLFIRFAFSKAGIGIVRKIFKGIAKKVYLILENRPVNIVYLDEASQGDIFTYHDWIQKKLHGENMATHYEDVLNEHVLISIIMPVYNPPLKYLKKAIESVLLQNYSNWELCIADDCSTDTKVRKLLHTYAVKDKRIRVTYRDTNGHISATSNSALELVTGDYILLMDHDDLLSINCVAEVVLAIQKNTSVDILYSDEDKIDDIGIHQVPHFKPVWAPDHLLSRNYIGHVTVLKKTLMDKIGGFRLGFEGSQDYDLLLRATEVTNNIVHIPKVLYHWRIHNLSAAQSEEVKPYAYIAAKKALNEALVRRGLQGDVKYLSGLRGYKIDYYVQHEDKVSIIIPTKDQTELLKNTIDSILNSTTYSNYEIIILNNNSTTKELKEFLIDYTKKYPTIITSIEAHFPFNFAKLMNIGAKAATGDYLLLLNNDVEVIHDDWLTTMVSYVQQKRIGAVGVKLLYPDDTIQHAGVIVGLGGIAGHAFVGAYKDEAGYFNYIQSVNNFSAVTAACLMVRKEVFNEVSGMDESFEVEYNDVDFCLKILDAGYNNVYLPQVELYHYESATRGHPHQSKASYDRHLKEMKLFKEKWLKYIEADPYYNPNLNLGVHDFSMNFGA